MGGAGPAAHAVHAAPAGLASRAFGATSSLPCRAGQPGRLHANSSQPLAPCTPDAAPRRAAPQAALFGPLCRGELGVWDALGALDTLREYETALLGDDDCDPTMSLMEHALQTAEACR